MSPKQIWFVIATLFLVPFYAQSDGDKKYVTLQFERDKETAKYWQWWVRLYAADAVNAAAANDDYEYWDSSGGNKFQTKFKKGEPVSIQFFHGDSAHYAHSGCEMFLDGQYVLSQRVHIFDNPEHLYKFRIQCGEQIQMTLKCQNDKLPLGNDGNDDRIQIDMVTEFKGLRELRKYLTPKGLCGTKTEWNLDKAFLGTEIKSLKFTGHSNDNALKCKPQFDFKAEKDETWILHDLCEYDRNCIVEKAWFTSKLKISVQGKVQAAQTMETKEKLEFKCEEKYKLQGMEYLTCRNGNWNDWPPRCVYDKESETERWWQTDYGIAVVITIGNLIIITLLVIYCCIGCKKAECVEEVSASDTAIAEGSPNNDESRETQIEIQTESQIEIQIENESEIQNQNESENS